MSDNNSKKPPPEEDEDSHQDEDGEPGNILDEAMESGSLETYYATIKMNITPIMMKSAKSLGCKSVFEFIQKSIFMGINIADAAQRDMEIILVDRSKTEFDVLDTGKVCITVADSGSYTLFLEEVLKTEKIDSVMQFSNVSKTVFRA